MVPLSPSRQAVIKHLGCQHSQALWQLLNHVVAEGKYLAAERPYPLAKIEQFMHANSIANNPVFGCFVGEQLIGWCDAMRTASQSQRARLGMGLAAPYRGLGLGQAMLEHLIQHCPKLGIEQLYLEVYGDNLAAIHLYEKLGFDRQGLLAKPRTRQGRRVQIVVMQRQVKP